MVGIVVRSSVNVHHRDLGVSRFGRKSLVVEEASAWIAHKAMIGEVYLFNSSDLMLLYRLFASATYATIP